MTERRAIARVTKSGRPAPTPLVLRKTGTHASLAAAVLIALRAPSTAYAQEQAEPRKPSGLEEITVTATRRELNLQEVPQSIAAFSSDDIERQALKAMEDYVKVLPSFNLVNSMPGRNALIIRGVTTSTTDYRTDSQTSIYLDDQPITSASQQPDVRLIDVERIEGLPGPQGTLFGSSSQTGTLHVILNKPDMEKWLGTVNSEVSSTKGGESSYDLNGFINVPIIEGKLAIRASMFDEHDGGYVDNVLGPDLAPSTDFTNADVVEDDFNDFHEYGGRFIARWNISDDWTADLSYMRQWSLAEGSWDSDPYLGDYKVTRFFKEWREDDWWQGALSVNGDLGFATLTAAVSYFDREPNYEWDNALYEQWKTAYYGKYYPLYDVNYQIGTIFNDQHQDRWSGEVRLTSPSDSRLRWLAGAFYENVFDTWFYGAKNPHLMETTSWEAANYYACYYQYLGYDVQCPLAPTTLDYSELMRRTVKQTAIFGEVTYDITKRFSVTGGTRWFEFDRDNFDQFQFPQGLPPAGGYDTDGIYTSQGKQSDTAFKVGAQFHFDEQRMLYFLYSEGFRLGGSNSQRAVNAGVGIPAEYTADLLKNYELGLKSTWWDNRLLLNFDFFLMHWDDYQLYARNSESPWWVRGIFNGNGAEQKGFELSLSVRPVENLQLDGSLFLADPEFTEDTFYPRDDPGEPSIKAGQVMPNSPKRKYAWAAQYTFPAVGGSGSDLWLRYDYSYQSSTYNNIDSAVAKDPEGLIPSWNTANFQVGLTMPHGWELAAFARNVWDDRAITWLSSVDYESEFFGDPRFQHVRTIQRPRTIGLRVTKKFE